MAYSLLTAVFTAVLGMAAAHPLHAIETASIPNEPGREGASGAGTLVLPDIRFQHFGAEQGLTSPIISQADRDANGFLWLATYQGLFRFDGYRFRQFIHDPGNPNSLSGNRLRSVHVDSRGRVWAGTESSGVSMYDPQTGLYRRFGDDPRNADTYLNGQVLDLHEVPGGGLMFAVYGHGIVHLSADLETETHYRFDPEKPDGLASNLCVDIQIGPQDGVWVGCMNGGIQRWVQGTDRFERISQIAGFETDLPLARAAVMNFDRAGRMWIGTDGIGLLLWDRDKNTLDHIRPDQPPYNLRANFVTSVFEDMAGRVWVSYRDAGIDLIDPHRQTSRHLGHDPGNLQSLSLDGVFGTFQDDEGLIWVPTFGGGLNLHVPANDLVRSYTSRAGNPSVLSSYDFMRILAQLDDGRLLIAARDKMPALFRVVNGNFILDRELDLTPGKDGAVWILTAMKARDGRIWLPTIGGGVFVFDPKTGDLSKFEGADGGGSPAIMEESNGLIWIGDFVRGVLLLDPETGGVEEFASRYPNVDLTNILPITKFHEMPNGDVWIGSRQGLYRLSADRQSLVRIGTGTGGQDRLVRGTVGTLRDTTGRLWIVGDQIAYTDDPLAENPAFVFPFDGAVFDSTSARSIVADGRGRIWIATDRHLIAHDPATETTRLFNAGWGIPTGVPDYGGLAGNDGQIYFTVPRTLFSVSEDLFEEPLRLSPPVLTHVTVDDRPLYGLSSAAPSDIVVAPGERGFSVEFAAIDMAGANTLRYAYKLEGYDEDWTESDITRRFASYAGLPSGSYRLLIRASDRAGVFNGADISVPVIVQPAFYQRLWFLLLMVIVVCLALYGLYRWRTALLRQRQASLESEVADRTAKIDQQRQLLEHQNKEMQDTMSALWQTQDKLVQSEKLAALGGLVAGIAHEVNTPVGLVVSGASQLQGEIHHLRKLFETNQVKRADFERFLGLGEELSLLTMNNAERAADLIKSFKRVSADQTSQQRTTIDLTTYIKDVLTSLKPMVRKTPHQVVMDGPEGISLTTNPGALGQVITNLVTNALTHAFPDNRPGTVRVTVADRGDTVHLTVADNGRGIPAETRARIFEPFFTTRRGEGSTGLGLHIVHNFVVGALKGTIEVADVDTGGTLFDISLPKTVGKDTGKDPAGQTS
ncbi:sensor histidine kinase [Eilatimonas milleporae]|uniref:histidine kinase n=1 Tax=Eilatimonas milleporae TaxID=911205 RepID=A0A3M0C8X1_9PROT|nr:ATP-binding protein [Eilatimonas milleporae]RMB04810.1 YXYXY domain-containing protein [Eilatimonas milleporae]